MILLEDHELLDIRTQNKININSASKDDIQKYHTLIAEAVYYKFLKSVIGTRANPNPEVVNAITATRRYSPCTVLKLDLIDDMSNEFSDKLSTVKDTRVNDCIKYFVENFDMYPSHMVS